MSRRTSRGRQKIEMKKMQNEDKLQVTFSKRRNGLVKMANEMCVLTGSQVALLVFSPGQRVYPFGSPDVNLVIERYENQTGQPLTTTNHDVLVQSSSTANQADLNSILSRLENEVVALKKRGKLLDELIEKRKGKNCKLETLIQDLDLNKLEELLNSAKGFHKDVKKEVEKMAAYFSQENNSRGTNPTGNPDVSSPLIGTSSSSQMAPIDSRAPTMTNDLHQNAAFPSLFDLFASLDVSENISNGLAPPSSREIGTAGIVQFAGLSRINGASEMTPGASSSKPMVPLDTTAPGFHGPDTPQEFNLGDSS